MRIKCFIKDGISEAAFFLNKIQPNSGPNRCRILMYHSIEKCDPRIDRMGLAVHPDDFYMQMRYLSDNAFKVIGLDELSCLVSGKEHIPDKSVIITYDDGYRSILENAAPILKNFGFTAVLFLNIDFLEKKIPCNFYWHGWPILNWPEARLLAQAGVSLGSHGLTHVRLASFDARRINEEIAESKTRIEKNTGVIVNSFSYPNGSFDHRVKLALRQSGFVCACSSVEGSNTSASDLFALKRTEITGFDTIEIFKKKLSGSRDWLGYVKPHG